jgi:hypothetical protein
MLLLAILLATPGEGVPETPPELPLYNAPRQVTPRARIGGTLRGSDGEDPAVAALVPDHVGITTKQHPALNWFLSKHTTLPIRFTLIDERSVRPLVEQSMSPPNHAIIKDQDSPSRDIVTGGMIERCEFSECLVLGATTSCTREVVMTSAAKGFWYDAMACLCNLIESDPGDLKLRQQRAALLKQVGLHAVAEWDLAQAHARRH